MSKKQEAIKLLDEYLDEDQELDPESINVCLDAINLSLSWKPRWASEEDLKRAEAFVSYSFGIGKRKDGKEEDKEQFEILYDPKIYHPGLTNVGLAKVIFDLYGKGLEKPIFAQWEVAVALEEIGIDAKSVAKPGEGYLGTGGVAQQFLERGLGEYGNIALVVHPIHSYRAKATTITEAYNLAGKIFENVIHADTSNAICDPESVQLTTRSEEKVVAYEIGNRTQQVLFKKTLDAKFFRGK